MIIIRLNLAAKKHGPLDSQADGTTNRGDHPGFQSRPVSKISQPIRLSPFTNAITEENRLAETTSKRGRPPIPKYTTLRFFRSKRCARNRIIPLPTKRVATKKEIFLPLEGGRGGGTFSRPFFSFLSTRVVLSTWADFRQRGVDTRSFKGNWMETSLDRILSGVFPRCGRTGRVCLVK